MIDQIFSESLWGKAKKSIWEEREQIEGIVEKLLLNSYNQRISSELATFFITSFNIIYSENIAANTHQRNSYTFMMLLFSIYGAEWWDRWSVTSL